MRRLPPRLFEDAGVTDTAPAAIRSTPMRNSRFSVAAVVLILFGAFLAFIHPFAGLFLIGFVLAGALVLLVWRLAGR